MFGIDSAELLLIAVVALVVIGPKDLPRVMRSIGNFLGQMRGMARHFRSGVDNMMREAELADMEKKWQSDNERIMREHPMVPSPPAPEGEEDWPAKGNAPAGEGWPEPLDAAPKPAPRRGARANDNRPKPPPRRAGIGAASGSAPPIPKAAPAAKDDGA
ncbi:MAG TPA: Sec-independent protein translocase protein TatB [Allosphingosinicella sp.]|nr:Sec-independent protein translocase protein TatB [Allosphingosinicella sp.]